MSESRTNDPIGMLCAIMFIVVLLIISLKVSGVGSVSARSTPIHMNIEIRRQRIVDEVKRIEATSPPCSWYSLDASSFPSSGADSLEVEAHKLRQTPCPLKK